MIDPKFFIQRIIVDEDGIDQPDEEVEISDKFKGICYNAVSGLDKYGKIRVYKETYPESNKTDVFIPSDYTREATTISLKLYFFDPNNSSDQETAITAVEKVYHDFIEYISGVRIKYRDNVRKRKAIMYLEDAIDVDTDKLYGIVYKSATFKFNNIYGQTFPLDDPIL
ncbi:MAG: hypothetical protein K2G62_06070 [Oscillospiraceae bacterium]|nr:hypothetical protein [Oscillospiraceae bacterium]